MILYKHFRATTFFKAFLLNAILISVSSTFVYIIHHKLRENYEHFNIFLILLFILVGTFLIVMMTQLIMFYLFAFGGGMLTRKEPRKTYELF